MADCSGAYLHQGLLQSPKKKVLAASMATAVEAVLGANGHVAMDLQKKHCEGGATSLCLLKTKAAKEMQNKYADCR